MGQWDGWTMGRRGVVGGWQNGWARWEKRSGWQASSGKWRGKGGISITDGAGVGIKDEGGIMELG